MLRQIEIKKATLLSNLKETGANSRKKNEALENTRLDSGGIWVRACMSGSIGANN